MTVAVPVLTVCDNWACAGGKPIAKGRYVSCLYGAADDNTQGCVVTVDRSNNGLLAALALSNVMRIDNELGLTSEYFISNLQDDRNNPVATITAKPVELMLNRALVRGTQSGRFTTVINDDLSAADWVTNFVIPSLHAVGQTWWSAGTITVTSKPSFPLSFTDETVMWLIRQILQNDPASLVAERVGETGYTLNLIVPSVAATPRAWVNVNVTALTREIDDTDLANMIYPAGQTVNGNDEPERPWWVPFRAASLSGDVVTLEDPSGLDTTILASDAQPVVPGYPWRIGTIPAPLNIGGQTTGVAGYPLYRALYIPSGATAWGLIGVGSGKGVVPITLASQVIGSAVATSLTKPVDAWYDSGTGVWYVVDATGNQVVPYTLSGPTAGTPIAVGTGPRRAAFVAGSLNVVLIGHTGSNAIKQIDPSTDTVTATSPSMTTPAHIGVVSDTRVYAASDSAGDIYRYNPTANTLDATIAIAGQTFASAVYEPVTGTFWAFGHTQGAGPFTAGFTVIDATNDAILAQVDTSLSHGAVQDAVTVNGNVYGVTQDGQCVCYDAASRTIIWQRQHVAWLRSPIGLDDILNLTSIDYIADLDCFWIGSATGFLYQLDAQTGGATVARAFTAPSAATPSVTLANSPWPVLQYDEVAFCRDDGNPLVAIPNAASVATYGVKERQVVAPALYSGSNRVLNGDLTFFDSSRTTARFLNPAPYDSRMEIRWDGYDDNTVNSFTAESSGANVFVPGDILTMALKSAGAGRVFQPGDIVFITTTALAGQVIAKATADGSGNASVLVMAIGSYSYADSDAVTVARPFPAQLLAEKSTWLVVLSSLAGPGYRRVILNADVAVPFIPGEMTNLYWGIEGYEWGYVPAPNAWSIGIGGADGQSYPVPAGTAFNPAAAGDTIYSSALVPMNFTGSVPLPSAGAGGRLKFVVSGNSQADALYLKRLWVQVGNADRGEPDTGAYALWQLGQDAAVLRGDGQVSYTVSVVEQDPDAPFVMGAVADLRDPQWSVAASPTLINVERPLPANVGDTVQPVLTLDNRPPSFVRQVIETTSNQG